MGGPTQRILMEKEKTKIVHCIEDGVDIKLEEHLHTFKGNCPCNPKWEEKNKVEYLAGLVNYKLILHKSLLKKENLN